MAMHPCWGSLVASSLLVACATGGSVGTDTSAGAEATAPVRGPTPYEGPAPRPDDQPEPPPGEPLVVDAYEDVPDPPEDTAPAGPTMDVVTLRQCAIEVPPGRKTDVSEQAYGHEGFVLDTVTIEDRDGPLVLHFEGGSSCGRGEPAFDPAAPGSQNGLLGRADLVELLRDEGTRRGYRGAAVVSRDGEEFAIVSQCDDELGIVCVAYRVAETQVDLVESICGSMKAKG